MTPKRSTIIAALTAAFVLIPAGQALADGHGSPCPQGLSWDGEHCYAAQLPEETTGREIDQPAEDPCFRTDPESCGGDGAQLPEETDGRAIDCPDGQVGYMEGGQVACPAPIAVDTQAPAAPAAQGAPAAQPAPAVQAAPSAAAAAVGVTVADIDWDAIMAEIVGVLSFRG